MLAPFTVISGMHDDLELSFPHASELERFDYRRGCLTDEYYAAADWGEQPARYRPGLRGLRQRLTGGDVAAGREPDPVGVRPDRRATAPVDPPPDLPVKREIRAGALGHVGLARSEATLQRPARRSAWGSWVPSGAGGQAVEDGGEDRGVDVIEAGEQLCAVAGSGQDLAQRDDQGGSVGAGTEHIEGTGELGGGVTVGDRGGDGGDERLPFREVAPNGVLCSPAGRSGHPHRRRPT